MRITNNMMTFNYLNSLNKSLERQSGLDEQLSDGKAIHRPSDDPIKAIRSLRFSSNLAVNTQYTQNAKDAQSWMDTTDSAMSDLTSLMTKAKELTIKATTTNTDTAFQAIGMELDGLISQAVAIGNTKIGDRYVFAGQMDSVEPFNRDGTTFTYLGDDQKISMIIQNGVVNPSQDSINLTGKDIFGGGLELLNHLTAIKNQLMTGKPDLSWLSNTALGYIEEDASRLLTQHTQIGSRSAMYQMAQNMMETNDLTITSDIANNDDLDVPKALIASKTNENIYNSALAVGAKILPKSLVDFLS